MTMSALRPERRVYISISLSDREMADLLDLLTISDDGRVDFIQLPDVLDELPLPEYRRFKVVRKEIEQLERERDELQAMGPMQRLYKLKRKADDAPSPHLERHRAVRQRLVYLNEERDREEAVAECVRGLCERVEAMHTLSEQEIREGVLKCLREMTLTVQLQVLRAESVEYSDKVEAKMDDEIWKRKGRAEKQLRREERERRAMFEEEETSRLAVERRPPCGGPEQRRDHRSSRCYWK